MLTPLYYSVTEAILMNDISFMKDGKEYLIPKNAFVVVDAIKKIAIFEDVHFCIQENEYRSIKQN